MHDTTCSTSFCINNSFCGLAQAWNFFKQEAHINVCASPWNEVGLVWNSNRNYYLFANELWSVKHIYHASRKLCRHIWFPFSFLCWTHQVFNIWMIFCLVYFSSSLVLWISSANYFNAAVFPTFRPFSPNIKSFLVSFFRFYFKISEKLFNLDAEMFKQQTLFAKLTEKDVSHKNHHLHKETTMMIHKT
jgi:hypothetical protein